MEHHFTYIAHIRICDGAEQSVAEHLLCTAMRAKKLAAKIGMGNIGYLLGLSHDLCKNTQLFQEYIRANGDEIGSDSGASLKDLRGKIDHSTGGAHYLYSHLYGKDKCLAQICAIVAASHHGGLIDCISPDGENQFDRRMQKTDEGTRLHEALSSCDPSLINELERYLADPVVIQEGKSVVSSLRDLMDSKETLFFKFGLLARLLLSFLIDADRLDTADFMEPDNASIRKQKCEISWDKLIEPLEQKLSSFQDSAINQIRADIADKCLAAAKQDRGIFKLCVPTGGGKTLASLRFALHHAKKQGLERVFYVVPYTSIIEQNADVVRKLYSDVPDAERIVLEHHSNLSVEERTIQQRLLSENWDAPIVFTTMVQFLNALFDGGTKSARRMHALCNSVIVFDEIQSLPIKCVEMFNVAVRFLTKTCGASAVLCTATQPLLDSIQNAHRAMPENAFPIIPDEAALHRKLKRTELIAKIRDEGWTVQGVAELVQSGLQRVSSVLIVVNTKKQARELHESCKDLPAEIFHLSTDMCPQHRLDTIESIRYNLKPENHIPTVCVSTALIEAGVDMDFGIAIRYLAGLNSVVQATGRCNRNGGQPCGTVYLVNAANEDLRGLEEIRIGQEKTRKVLADFQYDPSRMDGDLLGLKAMKQFYQYYFFDRKDQMCYPVSAKSELGYGGNLFSALSTNEVAIKAGQFGPQKAIPPLPQSFKSANSSFYVIDKNTQGVVVPYREGKDIIVSLCALPDIASAGKLLMRAQRYTVNVYPQTLRMLEDECAVHEVQKGSGILYLDENWYDQNFGVSMKGRSMDLLNY